MGHSGDTRADSRRCLARPDFKCVFVRPHRSGDGHRTAQSYPAYSVRRNGTDPQRPRAHRGDVASRQEIRPSAVRAQNRPHPARHRAPARTRMSVITRFAPSPTGLFHIGSARTALFSYLFAAHEGGEMRLRFEDTDAERSKKEFEKDILDGLTWLCIPYDTSVVMRQSERTDVYRARIQQLLMSGHAYEAEAGTNNPDKKVIRFKNPNTRMSFSDLIRGEVSFDTTDLKDFVIARSVDEPLFHLAVVVDDHEMGVTHVIRGADH